MPLYDYECSVCHHRDEEFQHIREERLKTCPACGLPQYERQVSMPSTALVREYDKPIEMWSIAPVTQDEVSAFKRKHPDVKFSRDGAPLARTRQEKLAILRSEGFEERN